MALIEWLQHALPVGLFGVATYLFVQRWLCDPERERGLHWRGMLLKIGAWNIYLRGLWLILTGRTVPYIPTAKERRLGNFWRQAQVPVSVILISVLTVAWALWRRLTRFSEAELLITTEVTWGMIGFLTLNLVFMSGRLYAAWEGSRR